MPEHRAHRGFGLHRLQTNPGLSVVFKFLDKSSQKNTKNALNLTEPILLSRPFYQGLSNKDKGTM